jgi:hypothetical protein
MAVKTTMVVFYTVTPYINVSEEHTASILDLQEAVLLRNVIYLQVHAALQTTRPTSTPSPPWEPQTSQ